MTLPASDASPVARSHDLLVKDILTDKNYFICQTKVKRWPVKSLC